MLNRPPATPRQSQFRFTLWAAGMGYAALMTVMGVLAIPAMAVAAVISEKRRHTVFRRLGVADRPDFRHLSRPPIWIHALSVGEMAAALPLATALRLAYPEQPMVLSASTWTGYCFARDRLPEGVAGLCMFPFDFPFAVRRVVSGIRPALFILVESDLWPYFIRYLHARRIPVVVANARLSDRSAVGYRRMGALARAMFGALSAVGAQTPKDARRCRHLGAPEVIHTGSIKFDQPVAMLSDADRHMWHRVVPHAEVANVVIAGSTHPGEETILAEALPQVRTEFHRCRLIIAPRDPRRAEAVAALFSSAGFSTVLWEDIVQGHPSADVVVIDRIGLLAHGYQFARVAFIGGSLVRQGGHNPLEAAAVGCPVVFGPDMRDFEMIADLLVEAGAAVTVMGPSDLSAALGRLLGDGALHAQRADAGRRVNADHRGAIDRTIGMLARWLPGGRSEGS